MSHVLHCGDGIAGMAAMPDRSVDHVITDPPYEAEAHTLQRRTGDGHRGKGMRLKPIGFDAITPDERLRAAAEMARVARRWILVFCQAEAVAAWRDAIERAGGVYKRACIWIKPNGQPQLTGDRPGMGYESIVAAHAPGRSRWNGGGKHGIYSFACEANFSREPRIHPTQKPPELIEALVRDFSDPGEMILDPFAGAGTLHVSAKRLGRNAIGWEKDPKFHAAAVRRIDAAREQFQLPRMPRPRQLPLSGPDSEEGAA